MSVMNDLVIAPSINPIFMYIFDCFGLYHSNSGINFGFEILNCFWIVYFIYIIFKMRGWCYKIRLWPFKIMNALVFLWWHAEIPCPKCANFKCRYNKKIIMCFFWKDDFSVKIIHQLNIWVNLRIVDGSNS